jgi:membrane-associated phospholipid phosphatase
MRNGIHSFLAVTVVVVMGASAPANLTAQTLPSQSVAQSVQAPPGPSLNNSVRGLFEQTIQDFTQIPTLENVAILAIGGVSALTGHSVDDRVTRMMSAQDRFGGFFSAGETVGGARTQMAVALTTYTIGRISKHPKVTAIGADLVRAQIVTQSMTAAIKMSVGRTRPDQTMYSFPSGHASTTFATATVLQRNLGWKVGLPAYGVATYVAASRVHDRRHFLSDVTFGAALGIVAGRAVTVGSGNARFSVSPAPTPGGGAVSFTWLGNGN